MTDREDNYPNVSVSQSSILIEQAVSEQAVPDPSQYTGPDFERRLQLMRLLLAGARDPALRSSLGWAPMQPSSFPLGLASTMMAGLAGLGGANQGQSTSLFDRGEITEVHDDPGRERPQNSETSSRSSQLTQLAGSVSIGNRNILTRGTGGGQQEAASPSVNRQDTLDESRDDDASTASGE